MRTGKYKGHKVKVYEDGDRFIIEFANGNSTKENRARKGAYIDAITMISEALPIAPVSNSTKTRADRRNEKAEIVCREVRDQLYKHGGVVDNNKVSDLILGWLKYGTKKCYERL